MTTEVQTVITVTPEAASKIQTLLEERNEPGCKLRLFVSGGGCSGLQYGLAFETAPGDEDVIVESESVQIVVDPVSLQYLEGVQVDYVNNLMGGGFSITNPNAVSTCGCGNSFNCG